MSKNEKIKIVIDGKTCYADPGQSLMIAAACTPALPPVVHPQHTQSAAALRGQYSGIVR